MASKDWSNKRRKLLEECKKVHELNKPIRSKLDGNINSGKSIFLSDEECASLTDEAKLWEEYLEIESNPY